MKMHTALKYFEVCFDDTVIRKVVSDVVIYFLSTRSFSIPMQPSFLVDGIDSKKNPNAFLFITILVGKRQSEPKSVWRNGIGQDFSRLRRKDVYCMNVNVQRNSFNQMFRT